MKRGKEDDKVMSPMFPRLHVNEREKGGPRAPPRNKMALYEQLSITSQRFNSELNSNHNTVSTTSSSQISGNKRPMFSSLHLPRSTPQADNSNATSSNSIPSFAAPRKRVDEEDYAVPVFLQPENDQNSKYSDTVDQDIMSLSRPAQINSSSRNQSTCNKVQKPNNTKVSNLRKQYRYDTQEIQYPPEDQENREDIANDVDEYSLRIQNGNKCDDDSDTSMVESISGVYITPDEVVGVIGQKHFWKARRAIVNQQRVFAVQVFELHRLIEVQKLFAGSPNLLHEDSTSIKKALKPSIPKQLQFDLIVKSPPKKDNLKENHLDKPSQKATASAENTIKKSSISSSQNASLRHSQIQIPVPSNTQSTPVTPDPSSNPWHFNQPTGHHWLVPVMSPTEGLIYKPYGGPDHTGSNPMMSNSSNTYGMLNPHPYGIPNSYPFFQGMVIPPNFPLMTHHGYFPPYGMPYMGPANSGSVVDQVNHFNEQQQSSRNDPTQGRDLQISATSSPGVDDDVANENMTAVIKVVPHKAVSANESAFRIFQSIQQEREQHELA